jgi:hypothetical protein
MLKAYPAGVADGDSDPTCYSRRVGRPSIVTGVLNRYGIREGRVLILPYLLFPSALCLPLIK